MSDVPPAPAPGPEPALTSFGAPLDGSRLPLSASQTVGPFLSIALDWADGEQVVPVGTPGAVRVGGVLLDGQGEPVPDGVVETWQADPDGRFDHPDDPRGASASSVPGFRGFGRSSTNESGHWQVLTLKPGAVPAADGSTEAPHLDVTVMARGMLDRVVTRLYFPDDDHCDDVVLAAVPRHRRATLVAVRREDVPPDAPPGPDVDVRLDIRLQGQDETVFFDL
ncbi:MAG TPA: protocatechuate 3,4-dioxygenase subunit alpha [Actinomycetales bacterium]|nr:protocatechuate 3,4-dioxygenase subunit alpha [Actinomycetales bacterium]